ncbi:2-oxo-4-hydroxy-4-carboxy-5-ureidoimidazoline decarboxylase [Streptomyces sp. NPDC057428]|uniref:2-oxo-4-hydroxy-4-carboxy-5-ureidoimidazoline decarboxylase n=1 Tax=Streptomyces sp. NPDC057428 TaxID=3346129 RepID=UPI0036BF7D56
MPFVRGVPLSRSSESHAGLPKQPQQTGRAAVPVQGQGPAPTLREAPAEALVPESVSGSARKNAYSNGIRHFNAWPRELAEAALLECCGSRRWALRMAAHRPYPDLDTLLAASDEAGYDLAPSDIAEALAVESAPCLHHAAPRAAHLALRAAHAAYESRFGHVFVICLDGLRPSQHVDQVLASIRTRLAHEPDEERALTAEEMRRLARGRIIELVTEAGRQAGQVPPVSYDPR